MDIKNLMKITSIILIFLIVFSIIPVISYATDNSKSGFSFMSDFIKKIGEIISLTIRTIFNPREKDNPEKLTISSTSKTIEVDGSFTLTANKVVTWTSSNNSVAKVDGKGNVQGIGKGQANIIATTSAGETAKCVVNVNDKNVPTKSFVTIAEECKKVLYDNDFYYSSGAWVGTNFSTGANNSGNPASSSRKTKGIDCSGYVSWVLYKYGCQNGKSKYKDLFLSQQDTSTMKNIFDNNTDLFQKVGKLNNLDKNDLKAGDIFIRSGKHVEIYKFYGTVHNNTNPETTSNNKYACYSAGNTNQIQNPYLAAYGTCNGSTSSYTVYRVIK